MQQCSNAGNSLKLVQDINTHTQQQQCSKAVVVTHYNTSSSTGTEGSSVEVGSMARSVGAAGAVTHQHKITQVQEASQYCR